VQPRGIVCIEFQKTLPLVNFANEIADTHPGIFAGDMNAHYLSVSKADCEPTEDEESIHQIVNASILAFEPGTGTRIGSTGQR
jgi:hypothetical protein